MIFNMATAELVNILRGKMLHALLSSARFVCLLKHTRIIQFHVCTLPHTHTQLLTTSRGKNNSSSYHAPAHARPPVELSFSSAGNFLAAFFYTLRDIYFSLLLLLLLFLLRPLLLLRFFLVLSSWLLMLKNCCFACLATQHCCSCRCHCCCRY